MALKIGINGFGRIGRNVLRLIASGAGSADLEIAGINDLTASSTLAHLLKYDSVHGRFSGEVSCSDSSLTVNGREIAVSSIKNPAELPWRELGVDIVLECTGVFRKREQAAEHLKAGAKKVIISAPSPDADFTMAIGVNHQGYNPASHDVLSCASCTTNCLAPIAKVVHENFTIVRAAMTTVHSYTNDQRILDLPHKDLRRARAAALSMIPTTTGAAKAVGLVLPELQGKIDGFAIRVPTCDVSVVDMVALVEQQTSPEEVNRALKNASENSLRGILGFCEEPLVSVDFIGNTNSSTVDAASTMVIDGNLVKVVSWYDNEMGFSARMVDACKLIAEKL
ncbi:MAG: type I glyceraldehyde-3-phosphate dehydrogenase [Candidatus Dadabacteria bacterium]|nr:MAG: type I glyceraldehyde-3-phosphate dehydrogenase [Candidatus Dadabacteria bacterium]